MRSFIVSNFLVNLRQVYFGEEDKDPSYVSMVQFASNALGNLGAPLTLPGAFDDRAIVKPHKSTDPLTSGLIQVEVYQETHIMTVCCG